MSLLKNKVIFYLKYAALYLLTILIASLIVATLIPEDISEKYFYHSRWFASLWGLTGIILLTGIISRFIFRQRPADIFFIHLGLIIIIAGGLLSSLLRTEGFIEISKGENTNHFYIEDDVTKSLNFFVRLEDFLIDYYPPRPSGMRLVKAYNTELAILRHGEVVKKGVIKINRPLKYSGFNFYQYGYDPEKPDTTLLQVVRDPSLPVIYTGYMVLLTGMICLVLKTFTRKGEKAFG